MRISQLIAGVSLLSLAGPAFAQVSLNEMYISHTGTDDQEFIELSGPMNTSLAGYMVLIVEGDSSNPGTLDDVIDLSAHNMGDGYFVMGCTAVANLDLDYGNDNLFENGTETFYLVSNADVAGITALLGTDLDPDDDGNTDIGSMSTIVDIIAMVDSGFGSGDEVFDGAATLGPDGTFFPAGVYRGGDAPNAWCTTWLDFNLGADRTPGAANIACPGTGPTPYCNPANANSISASGAVLTSTGGYGTAGASFDLTDMPNQPGLLYSGDGMPDLPFGCGRRCVGGTTVRGSIFVPVGNQALGLGFDMSGATTINIQAWYRDPVNLAACGDSYNLSNALMP